MQKMMESSLLPGMAVTLIHRRICGKKVEISEKKEIYIEYTVRCWNINNFSHQISIWKGNLKLNNVKVPESRKGSSAKRHVPFFTSMAKILFWFLTAPVFCVKCFYIYVCKNRVFRNFTEIVISPKLRYMHGLIGCQKVKLFSLLIFWQPRCFRRTKEQEKRQLIPVFSVTDSWWEEFFKNNLDQTTI